MHNHTQIPGKTNLTNRSSADFQEAILLADYAIKTALTEISELDQSSIKILHATPAYQLEIASLLQKIAKAAMLLGQAKEVSVLVINKLEVSS